MEHMEVHPIDKYSRAIMSALGDSLMVLDSAGRITYAKTEKTIGSNWIQLLKTEEQAKAREKITLTLETNEVTAFEFHGTGSDQQAGWFLAEFSPLPAPLNTEVALIIRDISEHKRAEQHLRTIIETEPECVKVLGPTGELLEMNAAGLAMLEVSTVKEAEMYGLENFVLPEYRAPFNALHERVMQGKKGLLEFQIIGRRGTRRWLETHAAPVLAADNRVTMLLSVTRDITERKRAEEALQESEERFSNAFKYAPIGMALVAPEGKWLKVNRSVCDLLGYSESELLAKTFQDITHPDDLDTDLMYVRRMLASEISTYEMPKRYFHKSGHIIWVRLSVSLVRNQQRDPLYFISQLENITERKRAEEKLVQTSKLTSLSEMSAGIAHEISNPLTIISGSVDLLHKSVNDPEKFTAKINAIQKATGRINKIVSGLRKYSRVSGGNKFSNHSLSEIIRESILLTQERSKRNHTEVTYNLATESLIHCDEVAIEQVVINLINNAVDAVKGREERWVKIETMDDAQSVGLRVTDSGPGIPEAIQSKLFDPFFTTKPVGEGTGLGLSITKGILDEHGATISVLPNLPNTCFEVRFQKSKSRITPDGQR